jgi:3-oxoacyl-(acyl-carrier-protein) synthase
VTEWVIQAASCVDARGYGNHERGWRDWPAELRAALARDDWEALRWSTLFTVEAPRFSRMDGLSRIGLMAVELLAVDWSREDRDGVGVCVETRLGSVATDVRFLETASPSVFTYTLPSTVIGEMCIRHRLRGPVLCLQPGGSAEGGRAIEAAGDWLRDGEATGCLCLACEGVDKKIAGRLSLTDDAAPGGWHAAALFLGRASGVGRGLASGSVRDQARRLCGRPTE